MSHQTTLIYTEPLLRHAVFGFWRRSVGISFAVALAVVALSLGALVVHGTASWVVGTLSTVLIVGAAFAAAVYFVHYRSSLRTFREMGSPRATFRAEESS